MRGSEVQFLSTAPFFYQTRQRTPRIEGLCVPENIPGETYQFYKGLTETKIEAPGITVAIRKGEAKHADIRHPFLKVALDIEGYSPIKSPDARYSPGFVRP